MSQQINPDLLALRDKFFEATAQDAQFDRAWNAVMSSAQLRAARQKLSIHELRLIIRAAITGKTESK